MWCYLWLKPHTPPWSFVTKVGLERLLCHLPALSLACAAWHHWALGTRAPCSKGGHS